VIKPFGNTTNIEMNTDRLHNSSVSANQKRALKKDNRVCLESEGSVVGGGGDQSASRRTSLRSAALRREELTARNLYLLLNHGQ
jgi:hypothetical protein